jgi:hypothetical protein
MTTTERMKRIRTFATLVVAVVAAMALSLLLISAKPTHAAPVTFSGSPAEGAILVSGGEDSIWAIWNFAGTTNGLPVGGACDIPDAPGLGVGDASLTDQAGVFDNGLTVFVNNQQYVSPDTVDLTGTTLTSGPVSLSGLNTSVQYYASPTNATLRTFIRLNNPTTNSITVPVTVASNFGTSLSTQIISTSSGDTTFTTADRYLITDVASTVPDVPTNTSVVAGSGTPQTLPSAVSNTVFDCVGTQGVLVTYQVTVPAGQTRSVLLFNQLNSTTTQATTDVGAFNDNTTLAATDFLAGLSPADLATVVNFDFSRPNTAPALTTTAGALSYTENDPAKDIDSGLTLTDADSANMSGATVEITGNYQNGQDVLSFTTQNNISGSFSAANGRMTLTGSSSVANYQTALRSVKYSNTSENPSAATRTVTFQANDGGAQNNLSNTATKDITVTPVNDAPTAANDAYSTNEDTALIVGAASGVLANDVDAAADGDPLTAVLVSGPSHAATNGFTLNQEDGSFSYTPALNFNGQDSFTYKANDGTADSNTATVTITVLPVNDAPSFTKGADQTVNMNAGAQSVSGWATNISAGPSDESGQEVSFEVTNTSTALFSAGPAVAADGTLTYTPAANANGSAGITVRLKDNGGTTNGGKDTSATQTFTINVITAPTTKDQCKNGGWKGLGYPNQGTCISDVNQNRP